MPGCLHSCQNDIRGRLISIGGWFDRIDPGTHRRVKGLRLVTAFGLAALFATVPQISRGHAISLGPLAAGFALWTSVSEGKTTRYESARTWLSYVSPPVSARQVLSFSHRCWERAGPN
jgi:hypothetical protein